MDGGTVQPKKRKRPAKKDAKAKAAAKSKDKVPLLDKWPNNWRPEHHLGEPMLPEHVLKVLTPDMRSLHNSVLYVEKQLLNAKDPAFPLYAVRVPTGMNFVEKYPADLCFIRFNDIFPVFRMQMLQLFCDHGAPSINFNQFLEKEKLKGNGSNFTDWFRHVRIFLAGVSLQYVLEAPLGSPPPPAVSEDIKNVYETRVTRYSEIQCAILCSLEAELQKRFEHHDPCEMMRELKLIFETHAAVESYEASKQFFNCMMEEGSSVSEHMFAMSGHAKKLSDLGIVIPNKLGIHRVLQSLPPSYKNFVMNYNMQNMNKELPELFSMLKSAEVEIKKENQVLMVNKTTSFKKQGKPNKGNFKKGGKKVAAPLRSLRLVLSLRLCATTARGRGTGSGTAPNTWPI
ncbi:hypothetical protein QYE76_048588 [Lolium multiflorum]|uniref:Uncharacterized protein n=1 Tax=Lolium multiflorum TaxID=4521 RepID=A0AAD8WFI3_LOLMU|nr:hypothetical protein QYE76_048588 [Lolium multiflorum]